MRRMKSLHLNGIIVGEYLGSDDPDEDIEAARDFLRSKGLYNPPSLVSAMMLQANAFAYTANVIYRRVLKQSGPHKPFGPAPFVVNAAFSVELYLKILHVLASGSMRGHKLLRLHDALPIERRDELASMCASLAVQHGESDAVRFRDLLQTLNDAFEQWRYVYELPRSGRIQLQQTILIMHTCRDVCMRAVTQGEQSPT